jgi:hypothetical protein
VQFLNVQGNLEGPALGGKQKGQASADFLGVLAFSRNVVGGCCIPTTTLAGSSGIDWPLAADARRVPKGTGWRRPIAQSPSNQHQPVD